MSKVSILFSLLALLISTVAEASPSFAPNFAQILGLKATDLGNSPGQSPPIILRQAKVKLGIQKASFVKKGTRFEESKEDVCVMESTLDVFDLRNAPLGDVLPFGCQSTLGGEAVIVEVRILMGLLTGSPFNESASDFKVLLPYMSVYDSAQKNIKLPDVYTSFGTRDLTAKSFLFELIPSVQYSCEASSPGGDADCKVNLPEYFTATVEIKD